MKNLKWLLLTASLIFSAQAFAVDSDGDGVDDSVDAFPMHAEASADTDGDGMPDVINLDAAPVIFTDQFGTGSFTAAGWTTTGVWSISGSVASTSTSCVASLCGPDYATLAKTIDVPAGGGKLFFNVSGAIGVSRIDISGPNAGPYVLGATGNITRPVPAGTRTLTWVARTSGWTGSYSLNVSAIVIRATNLTTGEDTDDDNDGVLDVSDNCRLNENLDQRDSDGDGIGDICDPAPYQVPLITSIEAGINHACALTTLGELKCWGFNNHGQLGDGTMVARYRPGDVIGLASDTGSVSTGDSYSCARMTTGAVKCWGYNYHGQLGDNTAINKSAPVDVLGLSSGVTAIASGNQHACALKTAGSVMCWGANYNGQLGTGAYSDKSTTPLAVFGLSSGVSAISAGGSHTCALMTTGAVKCWGYNNYGQLGNNTTTGQNRPVDVFGLSSGVSAISAGGQHTCALMTAGGVKCWGYNNYGQLGNNTTQNQNIPVDVIGLSSGVSAISAGASHTCALMTSGGVKCWGNNGGGQLGDGTSNNVAPYGKPAPVDVVGQNGIGLLASVTAISVGDSYTYVVTTSGAVKYWGNGNNPPTYVVGLYGDIDGDGVVDKDDNCVSASNQNQLDADGDTQGDACDADDDNDGVLDINDAFPLNASEWLDTDADGTGNNADTDDDNDGVLDVNDKFPLDVSKSKFVRHDAEVDGDSDVLIRSTTTGSWTRYSIQNNTVVGSGAINAPTSSDSVYVAQLDANGDGDADILTRSASTGAWTLSIVENGAVTSSVPLYLYANLGYVFVGAGDFNNDGTDDVMLRHATNGYRVFLLANHAVSSSVYYNAWTAASSVDQGIGDFNGDGTDDLLVRRTSDNLYFIFKTINGEVNNYYCACNIWANPAWTFQFAGDTNKDGIDDIVIRGTGASADGKWWAFRMNNFSSALTTNLNLFINKTAVTVGTVGDYNGDGTIDVLTRVNNAATYVSPINNGLAGGNYLLYNFTADQVIGK